jgi:ubiquinone/menaquinone biosynthesis C-methylase UbiE
MDTKVHWEKIYSAKAPDAVSWYQPHAELSLRLIRDTGIGHSAPIIDVGGGTSTLVDDLLGAGYTDVTVLDLSASALAEARRRLAATADCVRWIEGDVTELSLPRDGFELWHDRAVFHFLTTPEARAAYVASVRRSVKPGGHVIVATFAEDGPTQCSGLPVVRYGADALHAEFGEPFTLLRHEKETHHTPFGAVQQFVYCYCRKAPS